MRRLAVEMQALIDAMTMPEDVPFQSYLDLREGAVVEVWLEGEDDFDDDFEAEGGFESSEVAADPERYFEIPRLESREQYDIMAAFAASVDDNELSERLGDALQGRGAFSRFRRIVDGERELREQWFAFQHKELFRRATRWLASLDVEPVYDAPKETKPTPAAAPASPPPAVGLLDLLLLGAPEGKTELLEGQVLRVIQASSVAEARRIFTRVARELCWHFDRPWRKRFAQGQTRLDLERAHLAVEDEVVRLWIDVSPATWRAFG